jgi:FixJ family two-component response regulator
LRFLFISGYAEEAVVHHGVLVGNIDFLSKPFAPASLAVKVRKVLDDTQKQPA